MTRIRYSGKILEKEELKLVEISQPKAAISLNSVCQFLFESIGGLRSQAIQRSAH
jgi:hypothetical protein